MGNGSRGRVAQVRGSGRGRVDRRRRGVRHGMRHGVLSQLGLTNHGLWLGLTNRGLLLLLGDSLFGITEIRVLRE